MLWDVVYEFFVKYIFGGILNEATYYPMAYGSIVGEEEYDSFTVLDDYFIRLFNDDYMGSLYMPLGNYLSLIATIITMIVILVLCAQLIKKIYNICAHVIA